MKKLWLHTIRTYLRLGLFFYFKKIIVVNADAVPKDLPVLFLSNHQNALLDALLIATKCGRSSYFLTRAGVFKKAFISKLLNSLQMLPIYRIRDGWNNLSNNNAVFGKCTTLLYHKEAVTIFPEGSHNLKRTVRPLSKGFTRIVLDTLKEYPDIDLHLIPVGVNFINATQCVDSAALYFGDPISAKQYSTKERNEGVLSLKEDIYSKIALLTTHIPSQSYDKTLRSLEELHVDFLDPTSVNQCISNNFNDCVVSNNQRLSWLRPILKGLLILNLWLPYSIWKFWIQPKIKEPEFTSTFRFAVALTLVPVYLLLLTIVLGLSFGFKLALLYLMGALLLALITVKL